MTTQAQASALDALKLGAFLSPVDMIAHLEAGEQGEDLIVLREIVASTAPRRTQRWRVKPDGSPRLERDGTRLH